MAQQNYYEILGVDYDAERAEIRQAYQRLKKRHKNDRAMLSKVKKAWQVLGSPLRRKGYDRAINVARLRQEKPRLRRPAVTDVPGAQPSLRGPAKTDVPGAQPSLRGPAKTDVPGAGRSSGLQGPAKTDVPALQAEPDGKTKVKDQVPLSSSHSTRQRAIRLDVQPVQDKAWTKKLISGEYLIGRGEGCDIHLPDPTKYISRRHARLRIKRDRCSLRDEGSTNGTRLNGRVIEPRKWVSLKDGAKIEIEDYTLIVWLNVDL